MLHAYIAVPATRAVREIPTEVRVGPEDGMPEDSVLSLDNVAVVPRGFFMERICGLSVDRMAEVCSALAVATGC